MFRIKHQTVKAADFSCFWIAMGNVRNVMNNNLARARGMSTIPEEEQYCLGIRQKSYVWCCMLFQIILSIINFTQLYQNPWRDASSINTGHSRYHAYIFYKRSPLNEDYCLIKLTAWWWGFQQINTAKNLINKLHHICIYSTFCLLREGTDADSVGVRRQGINREILY